VVLEGDAKPRLTMFMPPAASAAVANFQLNDDKNTVLSRMVFF
jgi:hypothetical protein